MRPTPLIGGFLIGLVLSACTALPVPSSPPPLAGSPPPSVRPSPATPPPPILTPVPAPATPEPSIPADLSRTAVVEQDGLRLTIELERNPMPAGEVTWITTTVTNTGSAPLFWDADCDAAVWVRGSVARAPWRNGMIQQEPLKTLKAYVLDHQGLGSVDRSVVFQPKSRVDHGEGACSEVGHLHRIAPGARLAQRARWDGFVFDRLTPPPQGRIDLVGIFRHGPTEDSIRTEISEVHLDAWIAGSSEVLLDPAEAADVALGDIRLAALLASRDLRNGNEGLCRFDPATGQYQIGVLDSGGLEVSRVHMVLVDARTGEIAGWVERDWDYDVDGFP